MINTATPAATTPMSGPPLEKRENAAPVLWVRRNWRKFSIRTIGPSASAVEAQALVS